MKRNWCPEQKPIIWYLYSVLTQIPTFRSPFPQGALYSSLSEAAGVKDLRCWRDLRLIKWSKSIRRKLPDIFNLYYYFSKTAPTIFFEIDRSLHTIRSITTILIISLREAKSTIMKCYLSIAYILSYITLSNLEIKI